MIQMHDGKTLLRKKMVCKLIGPKSFCVHNIHTWFAFPSLNWTW
jgi:hypothetical protein